MDTTGILEVLEYSIEFLKQATQRLEGTYYIIIKFSPFFNMPINYKIIYTGNSFKISELQNNHNRTFRNITEFRRLQRLNPEYSRNIVEISIISNGTSYELYPSDTQLETFLHDTRLLDSDDISDYILPDQHSCSICLTDFDESSDKQRCEIRNCGHVFHCECIDSWTSGQLSRRLNPSCPVCRGDIYLILRKSPNVRMSFGESIRLIDLHKMEKYLSKL